MPTPYDIGDGVRSTVTFRDLSGAPANPTVVDFRLKDPTGAETTPVVHQSDTGVFYADFTLTMRGTWSWRWEGTGALNAAEEGTITVRTSHFS